MKFDDFRALALLASGTVCIASGCTSPPPVPQPVGDPSPAAPAPDEAQVLPRQITNLNVKIYEDPGGCQYLVFQTYDNTLAAHVRVNPSSNGYSSNDNCIKSTR